MTRLLRACAIAIVVLAAIDPAFAVRRASPVSLDVRQGSGAGIHPSAQRAIDRLRALPAGAGPTAAIVIVDPGPADLADTPHGIPVSFVTTRDDSTPWLDIVRVDGPPAVLPGQAAAVRVRVRASRLAGAKVTLTLEQDGVPLARAETKPSGGTDVLETHLEYAPPAAGFHHLRVVARADRGGVEAVADLGSNVQARSLRVLVFEPRPSWALTFVRHALEADPALEVAALARSSRGVASASAGAPARLTDTALARFDVVVVGTPEDLAEGDVQALERFARLRGGAVAFQPDRRPSGAYARRLPATGFDEVLRERPVILGRGLRASELALPRVVLPGVTVISGIADPARAVVLAWPLGEGQFIFSGALDAWRYRMDDDEAFARFWTSLVSSAAAAAPRAVEASVEPQVSEPGGRVHVRARIRDAASDPSGVSTAQAAGALVSADGTRTFVRLWPSTEPGVFGADIEAPPPGRYLLEVVSGEARADVPLVVVAGARRAGYVEPDTLAAVAAATGGVSVNVRDLDRVVAHVESVRADADHEARPMRSPWWLVACLGALCVEWTLRRRRGLR